MYSNSVGSGAQPLINSGGGQCSDWSQSGERGLDTLRDAQRTANDAEAIGSSVLGQLHDQRQQLHQAIDWREDMDGDLAMSSRLIRRMAARATYMKCILASIVLLLLGAIFFLVYAKWITPSVDHHSHAGRMLQTAEEDPTIGLGIIVLIAIGCTFLLACCLACAARPATRITVCCVLSVLYGVLLLILFLAPREDGAGRSSLAPAPPPPPSYDDLTDVGYMMRVFFGSVMSLCACCALVGVLINHLVKSTHVEAHATEPAAHAVDMYVKP